MASLIKIEISEVGLSQLPPVLTLYHAKLLDQLVESFVAMSTFFQKIMKILQILVDGLSGRRPTRNPKHFRSDGVPPGTEEKRKEKGGEERKRVIWRAQLHLAGR